MSIPDQYQLDEARLLGELAEGARTSEQRLELLEWIETWKRLSAEMDAEETLLKALKHME